MADALPEPWLRGPVDGIPALLQPAAHAFVLALEDVEKATEGVGEEDLWVRVGGAASIGFHLAHMSGATDRLFTYARGEQLSVAQKRQLVEERPDSEVRPSLEELHVRWRSTVDAAMRQLSQTSESTLLEPRSVGRAGLPSTVLGLLFHAAEHASRHTGQLVTTCKIVRGLRETATPR